MLQFLLLSLKVDCGRVSRAANAGNVYFNCAPSMQSSGRESLAAHHNL